MAKKATTKASGTVVYCGPTITGLVKQNTIYNNGLPKALEAAVAERPALAGLVVPLEDFPQAMAQLRGKTGKIYTLYRAVQKN